MTARRVRGPGRVAHLVWGAALAVIVGGDGSPGWRVVRVAVVAVLTWGAVAAARTERRGRAWPAIAHGLAGLVVGIAIGVRHATVSGLSLDAVAGLAALAAGIVLLVGGVRVLVHGLPRWRGRAAVAAGVVVTLLVLLVAFPAVMVTNVPTIDLGDKTPADVGLEYHNVTFETSDGVRLAGWYVRSTNGAAVVLRHGAGSTRADTVAQAAVLAGHGYGVLATDARGHGGSGGRAMDFGWYGDRDIAAAVTFLTTQPDVDAARIGVVGLSMGGEEAIGAAAGDDRIRAVVAEGATARTDADKRWLSDAYGVRGAVQEVLEGFQYTLTDLLTAAHKPTPLRDAVTRATHARFLVIAAGKLDDEQHAAAYLRGAAPDRVETWTVDGAGHTNGLETDRAGWTQRVTAFLDKTLSN